MKGTFILFDPSLVNTEDLIKLRNSGCCGNIGLVRSRNGALPHGEPLMEFDVEMSFLRWIINLIFGRRLGEKIN